MKTKLKNIATIRTGVYGQTVLEGNVAYLQARHFDESGVLSSTLHLDLQMDDLDSKHILRPGDVLIATKGSKTFAAVYENGNPPAVASTSFFVIRLSGSQLLPKFLAWFINDPGTQSLLKAQALGTSMVSIPKTVIQDLEVPIPSLAIQSVVLEINRLKSIERKLQAQIETLKEKILQAQINAAISKQIPFRHDY